MPDTTSTQAPSVDQTAASRNIRERAGTLHETARNDLLQMKDWPSLKQPSQEAVRQQYFNLADYCAEVRITMTEMGATENLTADYISGVARGLDGLQERIKEATECATQLMKNHDNPTQETTGTISKAPSVPE